MEEQDLAAGSEPLSELESLRRENQQLWEQVESAGSIVARLEETMTQRAEIAALREAGEAARRESTGLSGSLMEAVRTYRDLVLQTEPGLPSDMVVGGTIAEIIEAADKARAVVDGVRRAIEAENTRNHVSAGAPARSAPDVSALSSREKIRFALTTKTE